MELFYRITLFAAGFVNLLPATLFFLPDKISESYGIDVLNPSYELLLRHRAVLFGIIGVLMIYSAITKKAYAISTSAGLVSMGSFVILYFMIDGSKSPELTNVMIIDIAAVLILSVGLMAYVFSPKKFRH